MYRQKKSGRVPAASQSANVLMAVLEERAPGLAEHVRCVGRLARSTAVELGMDATELEALEHAAALHDIGKMAIPESILEKPGPLTDHEWDLIRQHTLIGERIVGTAPALERRRPHVALRATSVSTARATPTASRATRFPLRPAPSSPRTPSTR